MKKIVLLIIALASINSFAQTEKGKIYIGASSNLNFSSLNREFSSNNNSFGETKNSRFGISPQIGYFFIDNFLTGIETSLSFSTFKNQNNKETQNAYVISPFLKYYFSKKNIKPFLKTKYGFGRLKTSISNITVISPNTDIKSFSFGGGLAYFINNSISIELNLEYISTEYESTIWVSHNNINTTDKQIQSDKGFNSNIGFSIFL